MPDFNPLDITPELKAQVAEIEARSYPALTIKALADLRDGLEQLTVKLTGAYQGDENTDQDIASTLHDIRDTLDALSTREEPETPDFASPVTTALSTLQKEVIAAIGKIEVKPNTPSVRVDAAQVHVDAPVIDLSGIQKVLKEDIPEAFSKAISDIPETPLTDMSSVNDALTKMQMVLDEINVGVRLKPQSPSSIKVQNMDGSVVGAVPAVTERYDIETPIIYIGEAPLRSLETDNVWAVTKFDLTDLTAASGKIALNIPWSGRGVGVYE